MELMTHPLSSVRTRRQLLDIPASQMAARLGCTVTTYNRFERGERRCYFDQAITIAAMLGCTLNELSGPISDEEQVRLFQLGQQRRREARGIGAGTVVADATSSPAQPASILPETTLPSALPPRDPNDPQLLQDLLHDWGDTDDGAQ
jgi:transcriptional regulator with XRE-family HTH domain